MILRKLTMKNFRQFHGIQEIIFASPDRTEGKSVTVIFGENGRGKTGIYRAIMFCLYGDHRLSQDAHVEEKELHLVNNTELRKSASDKGNPVECFVKLEFSHSSSVYTLQRNILGMLDGDEAIEEFGKVILIQQTVEGNTKIIEDNSKIKNVINSILDHRVREYFLFDGEKIERLTRASSDQRKEISVGLKNLLDIDTLETAIKGTERLQKNLYAQLEKQSTGDYGKILNPTTTLKFIP
ncbi:MAG: AAA family ATPase [Desulfobacteraceae bacterium]|nr:AAA family ATPase [Desulfobacteraceae bacterium]